MQVSRAFLERDALPLLRLCGEGVELEASLTRALSRNQFTSLLQHMLQHGDYTLVPGSAASADVEQLDISGANTRVTLTGRHAVSEYCASGLLSAADERLSAMRKRRIAQPIHVPGYPIKLRASSEVPLQRGPELAEALAALLEQHKTFRYKKRYSLASVDGRFRVDLTVVRQGHGLNFLASGVSRAPEAFEAEVEYVGGWGARPGSAGAQAPDGQLTRIAAELLGHCGMLLGVVDEAERPLPASEVERVLSEYCDLVGAPARKRGGAPAFIGPQPVTLERRNLAPPGAGAVSILDGSYTVTDKADGTRSLLLVSAREGGECYLISNKMEVTAPGLRLPAEEWGGSLLDGEFITRTRLGAGQTLYAAFDLYWLKGRDVRGLPLLVAQADTDGDSSRLGLLHRLVTAGGGRRSGSAAAAADAGMHLRAKRFYWGATGAQLQAHCKDVLASGNLHSEARTDALPYEVDGVIFTPRSLPVGASTEQDRPREGTWQLAFKWKPPQYNSIDFRVEVDKQQLVLRDVDLSGKRSGAAVPHKVLRLHVGAMSDAASGAEGGAIDPVAFLSQPPADRRRVQQQRNAAAQQRPGGKGGGSYVLKPFLPPDAPSDDVWLAYLPTDEQGRIRCKSGQMIEDGAVVEFGYDALAPESVAVPYRWRAMRLREDKPKPNFYTIAHANWRSIVRPVTEAQLTGVDTVGEQEVEAVNESLYYVRPYSRDSSATKPMLHFHNHWVKGRSLLFRVAARQAAKAGSLFDIACGRGGDLPRWIDAGLTRVSGVDLTDDNLTNPTDGLYARLDKARLPKGARYAFVTADARRVLGSAYVEAMPPGPMKDLARCLWNVSGGGAAAAAKDLSRYKGLCAEPFDIVTCHFALHYFFESQATLTALATNIANHLAPGGYFVGTCFDAARVHRLLEHVAVGNDVSAEKAGRRIWSIKRLFEDYSSSSFGRRIAVYIETIGRYNVEYLVDFEALKRELAALGVVQPSAAECAALGLSSSAPTGTFDELWHDLVAAKAAASGGDSTALGSIAPHFIEASEGGALAMSEQEKQLSFLNRWFVFKKEGGAAAGAKVPQPRGRSKAAATGAVSKKAPKPKVAKP